MKYVVLGGGAAGFFGAIACANAHPESEVVLLEKSKKCLAKVRISGGGRCNVTHHCFDPAELVKFYPRGKKALRGPFESFQPKDTMAWFESKGVALKSEGDGRVFPVSNKSESIINCLFEEAKLKGVKVCLGSGVKKIEKNKEGKFTLSMGDEESICCDKLLITTGSSRPVYSMIEALGHKVVPPVPSLFTFNTPTSPLLSLSGISLEDVHVKIQGTLLEQRGPLLLTHWGFSGPAILKLSAWGARVLHEQDYKGVLQVNWIPKITHEEAFTLLEKCKKENNTRQITIFNPFSLPRKLWASFFEDLKGKQWGEISKKKGRQLIEKLKKDAYSIDGKTTFKEEFVTCGGVELDEVNFKKIESKICPGLYFAGEVLNIDGVTGGFNFQNAWTTSWIAGNNM